MTNKKKKKKTLTTKPSLFDDETTVEEEDIIIEKEEITKPEPSKPRPPANSSSGMFGLDEPSSDQQVDWRGQKPT